MIPLIWFIKKKARVIFIGTDGHGKKDNFTVAALQKILVTLHFTFFGVFIAFNVGIPRVLKICASSSVVTPRSSILTRT